MQAVSSCYGDCMIAQQASLCNTNHTWIGKRKLLLTLLAEGHKTYSYRGAWQPAQTKVPSESNLLYLPLPVKHHLKCQAVRAHYGQAALEKTQNTPAGSVPFFLMMRYCSDKQVVINMHAESEAAPKLANWSTGPVSPLRLSKYPSKLSPELSCLASYHLL